MSNYRRTSGYVNWTLLIVLVLGLVVLAGTAVVLRQYQRKSRSEQALYEGMEAYEAGQWEAAAAALGRYISLHRDDLDALVKYAEAQTHRRPRKGTHLQQAIGSYRTVLRADPTRLDAAKPLIELYLAGGAPGEAKIVAEAFLAKRSDPDIERLLASAMANLGQTDEAIARLTRLVTEQPHQVLAFETLGLLWEAKKRDVQTAETWFRRAVEQNPDSLQAKVILLGYLFRQGQTALARPMLEELGDVTGEDPELIVPVARFWLQLNEREPAERILADVEKRTPDRVDLWRLKAAVALADGDAERLAAVADASREALGVNFWDFAPHALELWMRAGRLEATRTCLDEMVRLDYLPGVVAFFQGWIEFHQQKYRDAAPFFEDALGQDFKAVTDPALRNRLRQQTRLFLASNYRRLNNQGGALQVLQGLVASFPNSAEAHYALARQYSVMEQWPQAKQEAMAALLIQPDHEEAMLIHTRASMYTTSPEQWSTVEQQLERLQQRDPNNVEIGKLAFESALRHNDIDLAEQRLARLTEPLGADSLWVGLGRSGILIARQQWDQAVALLRDLEQRFPESIEVPRRLSSIYLMQGQRQQAEEVLRAALERVTSEAAVQALGARLVSLYLQWDRVEDAEALVEQMDRRIPNNIAIKRQRLALVQRDRIPPGAQAVIDQIKALEGENGWQWKFEQARLWFVSPDFADHVTDAVTLLKQNIAANPEDMASRRLLAATYEKAGQTRLALATYREAMDHDPTDLNTLIPYISALFRAHELEEGNRLLERLNEMQIESPRLKQLEVQGYLASGQMENAAQVMEELFDQGQGDFNVGLSLALLKLNQQQYQAAADLLEILERREPNSLPVAAAWVQWEMRQGRVDAARQRCDRLVAQQPTRDAYLLRGRLLSDAGDVEAAEADYQRALAFDPNDPEVLYAVYEFHLRAGQLDRALQDIERVLALDSENLIYRKAAIRLLVSQTDPARVQAGRDLLETALQAAPDDGELNLIKAQLLVNENTSPSIQEATGILRALVDREPRIEQAWLLLSRIYLRQRDFGQALDTVLNGLTHLPDSRALMLAKADAEAGRSPLLALQTLRDLHERFPDDTEILLRLANTLIDAEQGREAVKLVESSLVGQTGRVKTALEMSYARALYLAQRRDEAVTLLNRLMQEPNSPPETVLLYAQLVRDDQKWSDILETLDRWQRQHGENVTLASQIAGVLYRTGNAEATAQAKELLQRLVQAHPDSVPAMAALGEILLDSGDEQEALTLYRQLLVADPENVIAMNNLAWLLSTRLGRHEEALVLADRGLALRPNYADLLDTRGSIHLALGQYEQAIADFERCLRLYPVESAAAVGSRFRLAKAYARVHRRQEAIDAVNQALEWDTHLGNALTPGERSEALALKGQLLSGQ